MTIREKELTLEVWMEARTDMLKRIRKTIKIAQASGLPDSEIRIAVAEILDEMTTLNLRGDLR